MCCPVNITLGTLEVRLMLSRLDTVGDAFCCCCGQIVGWKHVLSPSLPTQIRVLNTKI